MFYLEHTSFYKDKLILLNDFTNQALIEEDDGWWVVIGANQLYSEEQMLKKKEHLKLIPEQQIVS